MTHTQSVNGGHKGVEKVQHGMCRVHAVPLVLCGRGPQPGARSPLSQCPPGAAP